MFYLDEINLTVEGQKEELTSSSQSSSGFPRQFRLDSVFLSLAFLESFTSDLANQLSPGVWLPVFPSNIKYNPPINHSALTC